MRMENTLKLFKLATGFEEKYPSITLAPTEPTSANALVAAPSIIARRAQDIMKEVSIFLESYGRRMRSSSIEEDKAAQIMNHLKTAENNVVAAKKLLGMTPSPKL